MSDEENSGGVDISSRIKQFSSQAGNNVDRNGNVTHMKPNPTPRRRHKTEIINNMKEPVSLQRSTSNPSKKPLPPNKPSPQLRSPKTSTSQLAGKPAPIPRTSPVPPKSPLSENIPSITHNTNKDNKTDVTSRTQNISNKPPGKKPPLSEKPVVATRPVSLGTNSIIKPVYSPNSRPRSQDTTQLKLTGQGTSSTNSKTLDSWKKTPGPPKKAVPGTYDSMNPKPKPPRGRERSLYAYENHEITGNSLSIKNEDSGISKRCDTLDGLVLGSLQTERKDLPNHHAHLTMQQSAPPSSHPAEKPNVLAKPAYLLYNRRRSDSDIVEADEEDYDFPNEDQLNHHPVNNAQDTDDDDDIYCDPPSDSSDYELPPDAKAPTQASRRHPDTSDDEEDYDIPDNNIPPPVPRHKSSSEEVPPVPRHRSITENNLVSSSSDEDVCADYTDPEVMEKLTKPPVPIYQSTNTIQRNTRTSMRRGSNVHFSPAEYMPVAEMVPDIDDDDDMINGSEYIDPSTACPTSPSFQINAVGEEEEDIYSDEPLYQVYSAEVNEQFHRESKKKDSDEESDTSDHLTADLLHQSGKASIRVLWSELPAVRTSGTLDNISGQERKRQEAMFEVITSEASYLKSLDILVRHFMLHRAFLPNPRMPSANPEESQILDRQQYHFLFTGLSAIKSASERFLKELRLRQQESILIDSISDIILEYAQSHFHCYVKYCANQVFQDRTLTALIHSTPEFVEILTNLESNRICQGLSMQSFLTLPMQRITRLPLLVDEKGTSQDVDIKNQAICNRCDPGSDEFIKTDEALKAINFLVREANEGARKMERTEEMYFIQKTLTFKTKPIPLVSSSRWLVKKGDVMCLHEEGRFSKYKNQIRQIFKGKCKPIYLFLFTDLVLVTKMKGDENFKVIDQCQRSSLKVEEMKNIPDPEPPKVGTLGTLNVNPLKYAFTLILLENVNGKTVDYHCFLPTETQKIRWLEAFHPSKKNSEIEGEAIYEEWDCPQVQVIHPYQAEQSDELTLIEGDVISVLRKLPDGWAEGMRLRDDEKGWFPINHTDEIDSKHMRAKNLLQRYRLVTASKNIIKEIIGK